MDRRQFLLDGGATIFLPLLLVDSSQQQPEPSPIFQVKGISETYYPFTAFSGEPPPPMPTLQALAEGAASDDEIYRRALDWYEGGFSQLAGWWRESNPQRLKALFLMNLIHLSHVYGPAAKPATLLEYIQAPSSNCRTQANYQARLCAVFGLNWRWVVMSSGFHGWIEIEIEGQWELFDATSNTWIDKSAFELASGATRRYRHFYTPFLDEGRPDARKYSDGGIALQRFTPASLRSHMPVLGISFFGAEYRRQSGATLEIIDAA